MEKNIVLNPIWTSSSPSNVKELASGKLVQIPTDLDVTKNFYIICRNDIWLTEEEQYLIQLCREYAP